MACGEVRGIWAGKFWLFFPASLFSVQAAGPPVPVVLSSRRHGQGLLSVMSGIFFYNLFRLPLVCVPGEGQAFTGRSAQMIRSYDGKIVLADGSEYYG